MGFLQLATLPFETILQECIRMGITIFKILFGEIYCQIYSRKSCFTAPLTRSGKTEFQTSPNENFEYSYPLIDC